MKKIIIIVLSFIYIPFVYAFNIDVDKIEIHTKGESLISNIDKEYNIIANDYSSKETINKEAKEYTKKILKILFNSKDANSMRTNLLNEQLKSRTNGFDTLSAYTFINMFLEDFNKLNVSYNYIKLIRTIEFSEGVITLTYMPNATVDGKQQDFILALYLKEDNNQYKLFYPWQTSGNDLEEYFNNLGNKEETGDVIGGKYKSLSLNGTSKEELKDDRLKELYELNKNKNVSISSTENGATDSYGSGFYIRKGVVVTTWSLLLEILNNSEFIYVTDVDNNVHKIDGIITANVDYDVVLLKLEDEAGEEVTISNKELNTDDYIFIINSMNSSNYSIKYGTNISYTKGKYKNLLPIKTNDIGSAIYNMDGEVVAFNTSNSINNEISISNDTKYLSTIQNKLKNTSFNDIKTISFLELKDKYYHNTNKEKEYNTVPKSIMNKYKDKLNKIESYDLVKASYTDHIVSLRYKNDLGLVLDSFFFMDKFFTKLEKDGYKEIYKDDIKIIYSKDKEKIIIKQYLNYIIILILEN